MLNHLAWSGHGPSESEVLIRRIWEPRHEPIIAGWRLLSWAADLRAGDVALALYWPTQAPSTYSAWAAGNVAGIRKRKFRFLRVAFLGVGRHGATSAVGGLSLTSAQCKRLAMDRLNDCDRPSIDPIHAALMAPLRLKDSAPPSIPLSGLAPFAVANAGTEGIWPPGPPIERYIRGWWGDLKTRQRRYYGGYIAHMCVPACAPYFGFI